MKKEILLRSITGFPIGLAIGYTITIVISLIWANGYYSPCVPELVALAGNEINAVLLQALLCGLLGMGFAASSIIWEIEGWGIARQTGVYFLAVSAMMMPVAYAAHWMEHSLKGVLQFFGIFVFFFAAGWAVQYIRAKCNVRKMNEALYRRRGNGNG